MWTLSGDGELAELVGRAVGDAGLEAAAGQPDREAAGVVVAAGAVLFGVRRAAELAAPPDDRVFEQAAPLQVGEQARRSACRPPWRGRRASAGSSAGPRRGWRCCRRRSPARSARPPRTAAAPSGTAGRNCRSASRRCRRAPASRRSRCDRSSTSGACVCIRQASS